MLEMWNPHHEVSSWRQREIQKGRLSFFHYMPYSSGVVLENLTSKFFAVAISFLLCLAAFNFLFRTEAFGSLQSRFGPSPECYKTITDRVSARLVEPIGKLRPPTCTTELEIKYSVPWSICQLKNQHKCVYLGWIIGTDVKTKQWSEEPKGANWRLWLHIKLSEFPQKRCGGLMILETGALVSTKHS